MALFLLALVMAIAPFTAFASTVAQDVTVDASSFIGAFKNLQGTNNGNTGDQDIGEDVLDDIHDEVPAIAEMWQSYGIEHVLIYNWPDVFTGYGKNGTEGDSLNNSNYNWTQTDQYVKFVTTYGAKASIQFNPANSINSTISSPEIIGNIGYMIADRYMNGAHGSGFEDALELFDFYAEKDNLNGPSTVVGYENDFEFYAGFANGVARASTKCGVGAWAGNRMWLFDANYSLPDPYVTQFYKDVKANSVPIKALTLHYTNGQFSLDPYSVKLVTDSVREKVLIPAGLPDLPIWITEYEFNPGPIQPSTPQALADYNGPQLWSSYIVGCSMYAQDASSVQQMFTWTGFGYGGSGAGDAPFPPWFTNSTTDPQPYNIAHAWKLQYELVSQTPQRVKLSGNSSNGFAALAGASPNKVQVFLNNYQLNYDIAREIANGTVPYLNASTSAYPLIQENGLLNGQQACFQDGNPLFSIPLCISFPQAYIRNNTATSYKLKVNNLPWYNNTDFTVTIDRVGGEGQNASSFRPGYLKLHGKGSSFEATVPFPANTQDLVVIERQD